MRIAMLILLGGCDVEFGLDPIETDLEPQRTTPVTETFVQQPLPKVDLLFVVDRTASMAQEHAALASAVDVLDGLLAAAGVSWHVGVVGSEMDGGDAGWLLGQPWVFTASSGDLVAHLQSILVTVEGGVAPEAGLAAAIEALELSEPGGPNEGFRRADASLHLVFLSDADDDSDGVLSGDPVQTMLDRLTLEAGNGLPALASAVVGDPPTGCTSALGNALPGHRYIEVAEATEGKVVSICASDFAPIIEDLGNASVVLDSQFVLQQPPVNDMVTVSVDGERVTGWTLDRDVPSVRFESPPVAGAVVRITYLAEGG